MNRNVVIPILIIVVLFVLVGTFGWWMYKWQYSKADSILDEWAKKNNLTVIKKEQANQSGTGPGVRYAGNTQVVYRIEVKDSENRLRSGIAKIGSESTGTLSDEIEVIWNE
ncbi:MAG: hypothetical protein KF685_03505 [Acidobacteria bacterium]|nr:hypothetical protein [Acidobacteriota bacterium]